MRPDFQLSINYTTGSFEFAYPTWFIIVLWVLASILSLATIFGNCLVLAAYYVDRNIRQPSNYFIFSLAVSDLLIGLEGFHVLTLYVVFGQKWILSRFLCELWLCMDYTICLVSILSILLITIDRYCSVCYPAVYRDWLNTGKVSLLIFLSWLLPFVLFGTLIFGWEALTGEPSEVYTKRECYVPFLKNPYVNMGLYVTYYWAVLVAIIILYSGIHKVAKTLERRGKNKHRQSVLMNAQLRMVGVGALLGQKRPSLQRNATTHFFPMRCEETASPGSQVVPDIEGKQPEPNGNLVMEPSFASNRLTGSKSSHLFEQKCLTFKPDETSQISQASQLAIPGDGVHAARATIRRMSQSVSALDIRKILNTRRRAIAGTYGTIVHSKSFCKPSDKKPSILSRASSSIFGSSVSLKPPPSRDISQCSLAQYNDSGSGANYKETSISSLMKFSLGSSRAWSLSTTSKNSLNAVLEAQPDTAFEPLLGGFKEDEFECMGECLPELTEEEWEEGEDEDLSLTSVAPADKMLFALEAAYTNRLNVLDTEETEKGSSETLKPSTPLAIHKPKTGREENAEELDGCTQTQVHSDSDTSIITVDEATQTQQVNNDTDEGSRRLSRQNAVQEGESDLEVSMEPINFQENPNAQEKLSEPVGKTFKLPHYALRNVGEERKISSKSALDRNLTLSPDSSPFTRCLSSSQSYIHMGDAVTFLNPPLLTACPRPNIPVLRIYEGSTTTDEVERMVRQMIENEAMSSEEGETGDEGYSQTRSQGSTSRSGDRSEIKIEQGMTSTAAGVINLFKSFRDRKKTDVSRAAKRARKAFRTITIIVGAFALFWSPYYIVATVYGFCPSCIPSFVFITSYYMCYLNSTLNPFCYALANRQFRKVFIRLLRCDFGRR